METMNALLTFFGIFAICITVLAGIGLYWFFTIRHTKLKYQLSEKEDISREKRDFIRDMLGNVIETLPALLSKLFESPRPQPTAHERYMPDFETDNDLFESAVAVLKKELREDPELREAYKENIVRAFVIESMAFHGDNEVAVLNNTDIAYKAADKFLRQFCDLDEIKPEPNTHN